ncbi:hypothetical protein JOD96_003745 [Flavobacterium sp. 1355]|nr:hypothetical protein [Flavobacterium sp. 1355]
MSYTIWVKSSMIYIKFKLRILKIFKRAIGSINIVGLDFNPVKYEK